MAKVNLNKTTGDPLSASEFMQVVDVVNDNDDIATTQATEISGKVDKTTTVNGHALSANVTVTKSDVGLGSVDNTADTSKPISTLQQAAIDLKAPISSPTFTGTVSGVTKAMVGLGSVDNTSDASKPVSTAQATALALKQDTLVSNVNIKTVGGVSILGTGDIPVSGSTGVTSVNSRTGVVTLDKTDVGLTNVDNTADASKPVSTAQAAAIALKADLASPTFTGTVAGITKSMVGLSSVDNTADTAKPVSAAQQTAIDMKVDKTTTVAGQALSGNVTLTKTDVGLANVDNTSDANKPVSSATTTALGLKANIASPTFTGTVGGITKSMVGLGSVDNTADTAKPVSTVQQTALDLKANLASPALTGTPTAPTAATTTSTTQLANTAFVQQELTANTLYVNTGVFSGGTSGNRLNIIQTFNAQTGTTYTLVLTDAGIGVSMSNASANTLTVPTNATVAFPIGTQILVAQFGAGQTTIAAAGGVTINSAGGALKLRVQYSGATLIKTATNTWYLTGDITT